MPTETTDIGQAKRKRLMRAIWGLLLSINVGLILSALLHLVRGDPDAYQHQHAQLLANALSGALMCAGFLVRASVGVWFLLASVGAIAVSVWLSSGYAR